MLSLGLGLFQFFRGAFFVNTTTNKTTVTHRESVSETAQKVTSNESADQGIKKNITYVTARRKKASKKFILIKPLVKESTLTKERITFKTIDMRRSKIRKLIAEQTLTTEAYFFNSSDGRSKRIAVKFDSFLMMRLTEYLDDYDNFYVITMSASLHKISYEVMLLEGILCEFQGYAGTVVFTPNLKYRLLFENHESELV